METTGIWLWGRDFRIGEIRFSNAMTTSVFYHSGNSLQATSFGQHVRRSVREGGVAYRETWWGAGGSPTPTYGGAARGGGERRWLSYNHIGNVVNTSNDSGVLVEGARATAGEGNPLAGLLCPRHLPMACHSTKVSSLRPRPCLPSSSSPLSPP